MTLREKWEEWAERESGMTQRVLDPRGYGGYNGDNTRRLRYLALKKGVEHGFRDAIELLKKHDCCPCYETDENENVAKWLETKLEE